MGVEPDLHNDASLGITRSQILPGRVPAIRGRAGSDHLQLAYREPLRQLGHLRSRSIQSKLVHLSDLQLEKVDLPWYRLGLRESSLQSAVFDEVLELQ